jgi:signal transduction histidine kinase/CheY-like chemotaxis protein
VRTLWGLAVIDAATTTSALKRGSFAPLHPLLAIQPPLLLAAYNTIIYPCQRNTSDRTAARALSSATLARQGRHLLPPHPPSAMSHVSSRAPLLNVRRDVRAERRRRWTLVLAGVAVLGASVIITLAVSLAMRGFETSNASKTFDALADDFAVQTFKAGWDRNRDVRRFGGFFRFQVEATGCLPNRQWFDIALARLRWKPSVPILRASFSPLIDPSQRARFEATMTKEAKRNVSIFQPTTRKPAPSSAGGYIPIVYTNTGTEPLKGPTFDQIGWSWDQYSDDIRDLFERAATTGRVLTSAPTYFRADKRQYSYVVVPVYLKPESFLRWVPDAMTRATVPILYCSGGPCPDSFSRFPPDSRADFVISARRLEVPLFGFNLSSPDVNSKDGKAEVIPLCYPAPLFVRGRGYPISNLTKDPNLQKPCEPLRKQSIDIQGGPFYLGNRTALLIGFITYTSQSGSVASSVMKRLRSNAQVMLAAESVEGTDTWPIQLRTYTQDSWISATPAASWEREVEINKQLLPVPLPSASNEDQPVTVTTMAGKKLKFTPSKLTPTVWISLDDPNYPTPGANSGLPVSGALVQSGATGPCQNLTVGNSTQDYITLCPPSMPMAEYQQAARRSQFRRSFISLIGGQVWRMQVASLEPYYVDHTDSRNALIGGLVLSAVLVVIVVSVMMARQEHIRKRQQKAAEGAHTLVVDYCVSEVKHCNDDLVLQLASLQKSLPVLAAADRQLQRATAVLAAAPVPSQGTDGRDDEDDDEQMLLTERSASAKQVRTAKSQLLAVHALVAPALAKLSDDVTTMETSAEQLHEISNDFSDYSKLRAGQFEIRHKLVNLRAVIGRAVEASSSGTSTGVNLFFSPSLPSHALIDPLRMQQILINGLSNAARYSKDITMTVKGLDEGDTIQRLSAMPVSSWYKSNKPDLEALRSQVGCVIASEAQEEGASNGQSAAPSSSSTGATSIHLPRRRRVAFLRRKKKKEEPMCEMPPSFVVIARQHQRRSGSSAATGNEALIAQYLVVEIAHTSLLIVDESEAATTVPTTVAANVEERTRSLGQAVSSFFTRLRRKVEAASSHAGSPVATAAPASGIELTATGVTAQQEQDSASGTDPLEAPNVATAMDQQTQTRPLAPSSAASTPASSDSPAVVGTAKSHSQRPQSTEPALKGTSIGLALSSSLVERMDGWIALHDEPDSKHPGCKVTRYSVVLPCWVANRVEESQNGQTGAGAAAPDVSSVLQGPTQAALSPTTNHELSLIGTRVSGIHNLWSAESLSPLASVEPFADITPSPVGVNRRAPGEDTAEVIKQGGFASTPTIALPPSFGRSSSASALSSSSHGPQPACLQQPSASELSSEAAYAPLLGLTPSAAGGIPAVPLPATLAAASTSASASLRQPILAHVLVADDDEVNRRLAKRMLQRLHCSCDTIDDVNLAAACFERTGQLEASALQAEEATVLPSGLADPPRPYDFALFDILCGEGLGWEACQKLRGMGLTSVPIFAMTGNLDASELQKYHDAGMEDLVLGKPFTIEALEKVLEDVLEKKRGVDELKLADT